MKKKKWLIFGIAVIILVLLGTLGVRRMTEPTEKEKQITFLKEHESEMTEYVKKSEEDKVEKVEYDWATVKTDIGMAFTNPFLTIKVNIYDEKNSKLNGFWINIFVDDINNPKKISRIN